MSDDVSADSYLLLKNLEEKIREFIEKELSEINSNWWKQRIPVDVKQNAEERKQKDERRKNWDYKKQPLIFYIDFTDYEKIITQKNNWNDVFQYVFHDKTAISGKLKEIDPIRNAISHTRDLDSYEIKQIRFYSEEILRAISYYDNSKEEIKFEQIQPTEQISLVPISVSFDRTTYPINSTVHLRANIPELIPSESVFFQIFNDENKIIFEREITSDKLSEIEIASDARIYETSFTMNEQWKVGKKYVLKGTYVSSEAFDDAIIAVREPIIQSDKTVYLWGSDMILTVIDPDADKDNQIAEYVGDKKDAKLTIQSSKGQLENFRLRETGDSTGIFQGIIGFIGVNKDGTKKPYELDGNMYTITQGHQVDDGFIEVSEKDELKITYANATKTTKLTASVVKNI
ncbi:Swt1 family HEPN domain-containing protein [Nitrosarchaeum koreense]|uniref:Swt1-like HEPN domain-containing protein n=1 Tax=Nitrosarchaeum koreense MY1 TaxID=1001994 RepID=F9CVG8_9ARCH|nr:Swt1 family HEPN domain-containing protein [Nitrosarchaeum koreense]EGP93270.1 hypothetical protein MY1_0503 [Nitrosarchaeum koreense MY1]